MARVEIFARTEVGCVRERNEDAFVVANLGTGEEGLGSGTRVQEIDAAGALVGVCDGMGGAAAGEVASGMAVESIAKSLSEGEVSGRDAFARLLRRAIERANEAIFLQSRNNQSERGMGTTCTAAALVDGTLLIGQIGDSRCYVLRGGVLTQATKDQSLAWQLIEAGAMTAEEAKQFEHANIILQALGVQEHVDVVLTKVELRRGDVVLVCSDGLHGPVSDEDMLEILKGEPDLKKAGDALIARALEHEGPDNCTMVLARFDGAALPEPAATDVVKPEPCDPGPDEAGERVEPMAGSSSEPQTVADGPLASEIRRTAEAAEAQAAAAADAAKAPARAGLATFVLLALLAATAGGIFIRCDRDRAGLEVPTSPAPPGEAQP